MDKYKNKSVDIWKLDEYSSDDLFLRLIEIRASISFLRKMRKEEDIPFDHYMMEMNALAHEQDLIVYERERRHSNS